MSTVIWKTLGLVILKLYKKESIKVRITDSKNWHTDDVRYICLEKFGQVCKSSFTFVILLSPESEK